MKRIMLLTLVLCLSLLLAGCSSETVKTASAAISGASAQISEDANRNQDLLALQLAVGTLKLEATEYPISAEQTASLLPLWKAARSLGKNDTASTLEMDALLDQIKGSMTSEQWKTIQSIGSSMEELTTVAQEMGLQTGSFGPGGALASANGSSGSQAPAAGGMPADAGAPPDAGGGMPEAGAPASGGSSSSAQVSGSSDFMGLSETTLDTVIEYLATKI
jgi:predicted small secreted protein